MGIFDFLKSKKTEQETSRPFYQGSESRMEQEITPDLDRINTKTGLDTAALLSKLKDIAEDPTEYQISHGAMCYCPAAIERKYKSCKCSICNRKIGNFEVSDYKEMIQEAGQIKQTGLAEIKIVCIDCLWEMCKSDKYSYNITDWDIYESIENEYKKCNDIDSTNIDVNELLRWKCEKQKQQRERGSSISENDEEYISFGRYKYVEPDFLVFIFKAADSSKPRLTVTYPYTLEYFLAFIQNKRLWKSWNDSTILLRDNINIIERLTGLKL